MKRLVMASLFVTTALGAHAESFIDQARVRGVDPQYEHVNVPRNECSRHRVSEPRRVSDDHQYGGAIVGGLAGGIIGHQVGKGSGKDAATALGVVVGAIAGDRLDNRDRGDRYEPGSREVQRCRTVYDAQTRITGYRVNYEYRGQHYSTILREHPGSSLAVRVSVDPIER